MSTSTATLSSKYQIVVPKDIRDALELEPGHKLAFFRVGKSVKIVRQRTMEELFGMASHVTEPFERDRSDIDDDPEFAAEVVAARQRRLAK